MICSLVSANEDDVESITATNVANCVSLENRCGTGLSDELRVGMYCVVSLKKYQGRANEKAAAHLFG